jgi:hypothetical protein
VTPRPVAWAAAAVVVSFAIVPPAAAASPQVHVDAQVNGQSVSSSSADHPIRLDPHHPAAVTLTVDNTGSAPVTVHRVQLSGRVVGLTFYSYDTSVGLTVKPATTATLRYSLDLTGLAGQATGLIGGTITVFDLHGHQIAQQDAVTDVRGSLWSVYGLFGFALLLLTILAIFDTSIALARHRMPRNRWRRALRFLTPGIGLGLVLAFTLSAVRVWVPSTERWLLVAACFAVGFFVLGYLTPTPVDERDVEEDDDEYEDDDDVGGPTASETTATMPAVAAWPAPPPRPPGGPMTPAT